MFLRCVMSHSATFIFQSIFYGHKLHTPYFTRVSEVHGVHSLQEEAVLAVSSGNKRTRIGFVMLFTHMMDCDEATLSV